MFCLDTFAKVQCLVENFQNHQLRFAGSFPKHPHIKYFFYQILQINTTTVHGIFSSSLFNLNLRIYQVKHMGLYITSSTDIV